MFVPSPSVRRSTDGMIRSYRGLLQISGAHIAYCVLVNSVIAAVGSLCCLKHTVWSPLELSVGRLFASWWLLTALSSSSSQLHVDALVALFLGLMMAGTVIMRLNVQVAILQLEQALKIYQRRKSDFFCIINVENTVCLIGSRHSELLVHFLNYLIINASERIESSQFSFAFNIGKDLLWDQRIDGCTIKTVFFAVLTIILGNCAW